MKNLSKTFVWILMGLLFVGLAGFGAVNVTGTATTLAKVGDTQVSVDDYARALQQEQRAIQAQAGQAFPMSQLIAMGVDQQVLSRLLAVASLDEETRKLGISVGDETLLQELAEVQAFKDSSGAFNRDTYKFALENANLTEGEFEADMREETARTLVQGAILAGVEMPSVLGDTLTDYIGARRSFSYVVVSLDDVNSAIPEATEAELKAFYDANVDRFSLPLTKEITFAALRPDALADSVEIDETALRELYEQRDGEFNVPERRLVERLVYPDEERAKTALAQIEVGGATFEALVEEMGLTLSDVDRGDVTKDDLGAAADAVFAAEVDTVVGPLPSEFGPALYRVNGVLAAKTTSFDDAQPELREELAMERARRLIETRAESIDDLLAGGATIEELADEEGVTVGKIGWTADFTDDIAAYDAFRTAAQNATPEDFPAVEFLNDGSLFALRVDEVLDPRPEPFADALPAVTDAYRAEQENSAVLTAAQLLQAEAMGVGTFPEDRSVVTEEALTRTAYLDGTPVTLLNEVFEMQPDEFRVVAGDEGTVVVQLTDILPPAESQDTAFIAQALQDQLNQSLAAEVFQVYLEQVQLTAQPQVNQQALTSVHSSFQ